MSKSHHSEDADKAFVSNETHDNQNALPSNNSWNDDVFDQILATCDPRAIEFDLFVIDKMYNLGLLKMWNKRMREMDDSEGAKFIVPATPASQCDHADLVWTSDGLVWCSCIRDSYVRHI
ncbi:hypothetical protein FRC07_008058 [Ceratobasidium sp. 392]|nr:hypothetical protein FRC07_008058 [Ceratobasidium sp. 392]